MKLHVDRKKRGAIRKHLSILLVACMVLSNGSTYVAASAGGTDGHQHDDGCYGKSAACGLEEHGDDCYQERLVCGDDGVEGHIHDGNCYEEVSMAGCRLEEHNEGCYKKVLACGYEDGAYGIAAFTEAGDAQEENGPDSMAIEGTSQGTEGQEPAQAGDEAVSGDSAGPEEGMPSEDAGAGEPGGSEEDIASDDDDTAEGVESGGPKTTEEPEETEEPGQGGEPETTQEPEKTEEPGQGGEPETTQEPGQGEEPETTQKPEDTGTAGPEETMPPEHTEAPEATEEPSASPEPGTPDGSGEASEPSTEDPEEQPGAFDEDEWELVCGEDHEHVEDCYQRLLCGLKGHEHTEECYDEEQNLVCGLEEHEHSAVCLLALENQQKIRELNELIAALPSQEEIAEKLGALEEAGDEDGYHAYFLEIYLQARDAYTLYESLTDAQRQLVVDAEKLLQLEWLWGVEDLDMIDDNTPKGQLDKDAAYIAELRMGTDANDATNGITDGTIPFDEGNDNNGYDSSPNNKRVRTFDSVKYDFYYRTAQQNMQNIDHYNSARVYFEFLLPVSREEAYFSEGEMPWLKNDELEVSYVYEEELVEVDHEKYQVLHGSFLDDRGASSISSAAKSLDVTIRVLSMDNGSKIRPIFSAWLEPNEVGVEYADNVPLSLVYGHNYICKEHEKQEYQTVVPEEVTVTCEPRYMVSLERGEIATTSYIGDFDFSIGNELALDKTSSGSAPWNGRMSSYGIRVMVQGIDKDHGLKGCAFPKEGDTFEFDLHLKTAFHNDTSGQWQDVTREFKPMIWSADEFMGDMGTPDYQQDGRNLTGTTKPSYAAPYNYLISSNPDLKRMSCRDGGKWSFKVADEEFQWSWLGGDKPYQEEHRIIHVTLTDYTFDPTQLPYTHERGYADSTNYYNPAEVGDEYWRIQNAIFSTGEIWIVTPFYKTQGKTEADYITRVMEADSLTLYNDIHTYDIKVKNETGGIVYERNGWLEKNLSTITLQNPGEYDTFCSILKPLRNYDTPLTDGCFKDADSLKDYATPGTYVDLETWVCNDNAEGDNAGIAYNIMTKFDNACFEPVTWREIAPQGAEGVASYNWREFEYVGHAQTTWPMYDIVDGYDVNNSEHRPQGPKMLYGTTKDKKGWNHTKDGKALKPNEDGYDEEMMRADADDLIWYDSMEELKEDGAQCVAVMMEVRNVSNDGTLGSDRSQMNHLHMFVHGKIKDDVEPGYVYAISSYSKGWTRGDVQKLAAEKYTDGDVSKLTVWDYLRYTHYDFPSWSPNATNKMSEQWQTFPQPKCENNWRRSTGGYSQGLNGANGYGTSRKSQINEDGTFQEGNGGFYFIDCVYVVSYQTQVGIKVAQTLENGNTRNQYSMDAGQRAADFVITPSAVRSATDTGGSGETEAVKTDITVKATLPKGLTYKEGSAYWKVSEYIPDKSAQTSGTIKGTQIEPVAEVNPETGVTTLTWTLKDYELNGSKVDIPPIYFSCTVGDLDDPENDVKNNEILKISADIYSKLEGETIHGTKYGNEANTSITISKQKALTIIKTADQTVMDLGDSLGFTMKVHNATENAAPSVIADIMPANGIGQSSYHGIAQIEEFRMTDWGGVKPEDVTFYYTTDERYRDATDVTGTDFGDSSVWTAFSLTDNAWKPDEQTKQITAIAYKCTIPGKSTIQMHITLRLPDGEPGDVVHGRLMLDSLSSGDRSQIVTRNLEGLVWMDYNADGIRNDGAIDYVFGVKVELLKLRDGCEGLKDKVESYESVCYPGTKIPVSISTGQQVSYRKGNPENGQSAVSGYEPGKYKFLDLPAGTYAVRFSSGDTNIKKWYAPIPNQGADDGVDSDGLAVPESIDQRVEYTYIPGIVLPTIDEMKQSRQLVYDSRNNDSGFYAKYGILLRKTDAEGDRDLSGAEFRMESSGETLSFTGNAESGYSVWIKALVPNKPAEAVDILSVESGGLHIGNLLVGDYTLTEEKAPEGYALLGEPVGISIAKDGTLTISGGDGKATIAKDNGDLPVLTVRNSEIYTLPSTGGSGTGTYAAAGTLLMLCSLLYAFCGRKKKVV